MEDQKVLKALVDDSVRDLIREVKDSISKEMTEMREILMEIVSTKVSMGDRRQELAPVARTPRHKQASVEFGWFYGNNHDAWIFLADRYFDFYKIEEDQRLTVASFYFDGEALEWYKWLFRNKQLVD